MHRGKHNLQFSFQGSFLTFYKYYSIIFIKSQIFYFAFSQNQDAPREGAKYYIPLCQNFMSSGVDLSYFLDKSMCTSVNIKTKVSKVSKVIAYTNNRQGQIQNGGRIRSESLERGGFPLNGDPLEIRTPTLLREREISKANQTGGP